MLKQHYKALKKKEKKGETTGPDDGIQAEAWKSFGELEVGVLWNLFRPFKI